MAVSGIDLIRVNRQADLVHQKVATKADLRYHRFTDRKAWLLPELADKAPGTYCHSMIVGDLAAPAAYHIGANPDLARAAAYYHDIGKLVHPQLYLEYFTGTRCLSKPIDDPDDLVAILSHPEISRQKLLRIGFPNEICRMASEHHGNIRTRIEISPELLRSIPEHVLYYKGPLPSSRESAIVMLADSCQAMFERKSSRENWPDHPERDFLRNFVEQIGRELRLAGQFKMSGLSENAQKKVEGCLMWWLFRFYNNLDTTGTPNGLDVRRVSNPPKNSI